MIVLKSIIKVIDAFSQKTGVWVSWLTTLLVVTVFYDVIMRYVFKNGSIAVQEMEWHIFSVIFLLGAAFTLKHDGHVRVDIIYTRLGSKTKAWVDFIGTFIFLIPFALMIIYSTKPFIMASWAVKEISPDPGGLPFRYVLKAMIPIGFLFLIVQGVAQALKSLLVILGEEDSEMKRGASPEDSVAETLSADSDDEQTGHHVAEPEIGPSKNGESNQ